MLKNAEIRAKGWSLTNLAGENLESTFLEGVRWNESYMYLVRLSCQLRWVANLPSLSHEMISPVSSLQRIPTSPQRPGKLPCELLATAAVQTSYVKCVQNERDTTFGVVKKFIKTVRFPPSNGIITFNTLRVFSYASWNVISPSCFFTSEEMTLKLGCSRRGCTWHQINVLRWIISSIVSVEFRGPNDSTETDQCHQAKGECSPRCQSLNTLWLVWIMTQYTYACN